MYPTFEPRFAERKANGISEANCTAPSGGTRAKFGTWGSWALP